MKLWISTAGRRMPSLHNGLIRVKMFVVCYQVNVFLFLQT